MTQSDRRPYRVGGMGAGALNEAIPRSPEYDPRASEIVALFRRDVSLARIAIVAGASLYEAAPSDPVWDVRLVTRKGERPGKHVYYVRAPETIKPGAAYYDDAPLVIYDPSSAAASKVEVPEVRIWRADVDRKQHRVYCEGWGRFDAGLCSDGLPSAGWGTGWGLSSDAGLITRRDMGHNVFDHALRLCGPPTTSGRWRLPARKSDQGGSGPVEMGMRFMLDRSVDPESRTVPGDDPQSTLTLRKIIRCLQTYGMVVTDGSGDENLWLLLAESPVTAGDMFASAPHGIAGNIIRDRSTTGDGIERRPSDGVPWEKLNVLAHSTFS